MRAPDPVRTGSPAPVLPVVVHLKLLPFDKCDIRTSCLGKRVTKYYYARCSTMHLQKSLRGEQPCFSTRYGALIRHASVAEARVKKLTRSLERHSPTSSLPAVPQWQGTLVQILVNTHVSKHRSRELRQVKDKPHTQANALRSLWQPCNESTYAPLLQIRIIALV